MPDAERPAEPGAEVDVRATLLLLAKNVHLWVPHDQAGTVEGCPTPICKDAIGAIAAIDAAEARIAALEAENARLRLTEALRRDATRNALRPDGP